MSGLLGAVIGAVLAGGRSSRFGSNKAEARLGGRMLVEHAAATLRPFVDTTVVIGEAIGGLPDLPRPDLGPLGGIAAALDHAASRGYARVLTIGCDMPEVPTSLIEALLRREPSYCPDAPVLGLWPAAAGAQLLAYLETSTDHSVRGWARTIGALPIPAALPLANVNTPADLRAIEQDALVP